MADRDFRSELDALENEPAPAPSAGVSETARDFEGTGLFDGLETQQKIDNHLVEQEARDQSAVGVLGSWGTLDEAGKQDWIKNERAFAKSSEEFWGGLRKVVPKTDKEAPVDESRMPPFMRAARSVMGWGSRKVDENIARAKRRQFLTDQMEAGEREAAKYGTTRNLTEQFAGGLIETGIGGMVSGFGRADQYVGQSLLKSQSTAGKVLGLTGVLKGRLVKDFGDWISEKSRQMFPKDEARQEEFSSALAQGAGSMAAFMGPALTASLLTKAGPKTLGALVSTNPKLAGEIAASQAKVSGLTVAGGTGALMEAESLAQEAEAAKKAGKPVTDDDVFKAFMLGLPLGATEALPIGNLFSVPEGAFARAVLREAFEEGGQEFGQTVGENFVAQQYFDPERTWDDGAWEAGAIGALLGGNMEAGRRAYARVRGRGTVTDVEPSAAATETAPPDSRVIDLDEFSPVELQNPPQAPVESTEPVPTAATTDTSVPTPAAPGSTVGQETSTAYGERPPVPGQGYEERVKDTQERLRVWGRSLDNMDANAAQLDAIDARLEWLRAGAVGDDPVVGGPGWEKFRNTLERLVPSARKARIDDRIKNLEAKRESILHDERVTRPTVEQNYAAAEAEARALAEQIAGQGETVPTGIAASEVPKEQIAAAREVATEIAADPTVQTVVQAVETNPEASQVVEQIASALVAPNEKLATLVERAAPVNRKARLAVLAEDAGLSLPDEVFSRPLKEIKAEIAKAVEAQQAAPQTGTATELEPAQPEEAASAEPDLSERFREVLASNARVQDWPSLLGATPEEMNALVEQAISNGVLTRTKTGTLRKTKPKARRLGERLSDVMQREGSDAVERLVSQASPLAIAPDVRIDRAVELRERRTGKPVPTVVTDYALRIEEARGTPALEPIVAEIKADKLMKKSDVHDLAHLVGYPVSKSTTKQDALGTIVERHRELLASQVQAGQLASIGSLVSRFFMPFRDRWKAARLAKQFPNERSSMGSFNSPYGESWGAPVQNAGHPNSRFTVDEGFHPEILGDEANTDDASGYQRAAELQSLRRQLRVVDKNAAPEQRVAEKRRLEAEIEQLQDILAQDSSDIRALDDFLDHNVDIDSEATSVSSQEFYEAYSRSLKRKGLKPVDPELLGVFLANEYSIESESGRYRGIALRPPYLTVVPPTLASLAAINTDARNASIDAATGRSARRALDALGFYSGLDEALKGFKPTDSVTAETLAKRGVKKAELEARGMGDLLAEGKAVKVSDLQEVAGQNRVGVREVNLGHEPLEATIQRELKELHRRSDGRFEWRGMVFDTEADARHAVRETTEEIAPFNGAESQPKWSRYSLDPDNPTYRETVLHLPASRSLEEFAKATGQTITPANRSLVEASYGMDSAKDFRSGHFPEPNVIAHARTSIQKDAQGKDVFVVNELQSDWGQGIRDGAMDEFDLVELEGMLAKFKAVREDLQKPKKDVAEFEQTPFGFDRPLRDDAEQIAPQSIAKHFGEDDWGYNNPSDYVELVRNEIQRLEAEVDQAKSRARIPAHPLVNTTDQWVNVGLRRMIRQAVESGADQIAIPSGETVKAFGMGGQESGLKYAYDEMYPKNLRNLLQRMDKAVEGKKIDHLFGVNGQRLERSHGFTTFPITDEIKRKVVDEGLALFARGQPPLGQAPTLSSPQLEESPQDLADSLFEYLQAMIPPDVAIRIKDRVYAGGFAEAFGQYDPVARIVEIATTPFGMYDPVRARMTARHETIHILRMIDLIKPHEWELLVGHAHKIGLGESILDTSVPENPVDLLPIYEREYRAELLRVTRNRFMDAGYYGDALEANLAYYEDNRLQKDLDELLNQERVAKMAETWLEGKATYPSKIQALLARIKAFFDALMNYTADLGFETIDDVMQRIFSGEVASRGVMPRTIRLPGGPKVSGYAITAFHGSPHDFDKFDASKIGTGEGAQAYGHGLYFAESEAVAQTYKGAGPRQQWFALDFLEVQGRLYEVRLNAEPEQFLDWDKPLSQQSEEVQKALSSLMDADRPLRWDGGKLRHRFTNDDIGTVWQRAKSGGYRAEGYFKTPDGEYFEATRPTRREAMDALEAGANAHYKAPRDPLGREIMEYRSRGEPNEVGSADLAERGIVGLRYLDGMSRAKGEGSVNYVIFPGNDNLIEIVAIDGKPVERSQNEPALTLASIGRVSPTTRSAGIPSTAVSLSPFSKDTEIKSDPDYRAAKDGDVAAAARMVERLISPDLVAQAESQFGPDVVYVPVIAEEATGNNKIPGAVAHYLAVSTGARATDDIVQSSRAFHTGARPLERLIARPRFDGSVDAGRRYVLVDDVSVMGGTLAELANHIVSNGGEVAGVVTLVNASRTGEIAPNAKDIAEIESRYGNLVRDELGIEPQSLTADEARYILNFRDADSLRGSIAKARRERGERLLSKGIRTAEGEVEQARSATDSLEGTSVRVPEALTRWLGIEHANFQANYTAIARKRSDNPSPGFDLTDPSVVRALVEDVLTRATIAVRSDPNTPNQWTLVATNGQDSAVGVRLTNEKGNRYNVATALVLEPGQLERRFIGAAQTYGTDGVRWKDARTAATILELIRRGVGLPEGSATTPTLKVQGVKGPVHPYLQEVLDALEGSQEGGGITLASIGRINMRDPESTTPHLDMSKEARLARAEAMGFDTNRVLYNGSFRQPVAFDLGFSRKFHPNSAGVRAVWLSPSETRAGWYADRQTERTSDDIRAENDAKWFWQRRREDDLDLPKGYVGAYYIRPGRQAVFDMTQPDNIEDVEGIIRGAHDQGYDTVILKEHQDMPEDGVYLDEVIVFDPTDIRSVDAAFDPAEESSPLLLASIGRIGSGTPVLSADTNRQDLTKPEQTLADLVKSVTRALGLTVRQGRIDPGLKRSASARGNQVAGQFSQATGVTRIAIPNDLATLAHEGGHSLEVRPSVRVELDALKQAHVEELASAPAQNTPAPTLAPGQGFSGLELDAETQTLAQQAAEADITWRALAASVGAAKAGGGLVKPGAYDQAAYAAAQEEAATSRAALIRRLGRPTADAVVADITKAERPDMAAWIATRYSSTGTPLPRPAITATPTELSEGFAEWFRLYVTNRREAAAVAPRFFAAFEEMLETAEPELLDTLQEIERQVDALTKASPVGALRSRIQSTVKPGMFQALREEIADKGLGDTIGDRVYGFYHAFFDARHPMKRAVKFLLKTAEDNLGLQLQGKDKLLIKAIDDPYKLWRLSEHSKVHATAALQNGITNTKAGQVDPVGPSFWDAMVAAFGGRSRSAWSDENAELFGSYLVARRMLAEFQRFDKGELEQLPDQVISRDIWQKAKDQIEKQFPDFKAAAGLLYAFNRNALKLKLDNGFLTQDLYDDLIQRPDYVPLNRIMDDGSPSLLGKSARGNNKRRLIYKFQGSTRDFINPLESIVQDMYATQARIALNDVIGAMDRLARSVGPGGGAIAERLPANEMKGTTMDLREAIKSAAKAQNISQSDKEGLLDIIDDLFDQDAAATIFRSTEINEKGEPIVYLWENGKKVPIRLGDNRIAQDIFQGFAAFGQDNQNIIVDVAALGTQALRAGITKAPAYILTNFLRDQVATWILSENFTPFATGAKGLKNVIANDQTAARYSAFAGLMGGVDANLIDTAAHKRDVLTLRRKGFSAVPAKSGIGQVWQTTLRAMEITEAASRFGHFEAAYQRALKDGLSPVEAAYEAAYAAHDVMDFSRRGSKMVQMARIVAFLNASLQGLDAARRTMTGERDSYTNFRKVVTPYLKGATGSPLTIAEKKDLPNSTRFWMKAVAIGMAGVALAALYRDDPEYDEFDDQMRATHWFFKINGTWWRVPKPFELAFFSNLFEAGFSRFWKGNERAHRQFLSSLRHTMVPPHEMNLVKAYYEWQTGVDLFRGTKIVPTELGALPPEMQFTAYTSELGKMIGKITNLSPAQVDQVIGGLLGTVGRDLMGLSNTALPALNRVTGGNLPGVATEPRAQKSFEDSWIVSRFTRRASRGSLSARQFWDDMAQDGGKFISAAEGYKNLRRAGDTRGARDLIEYLGDEEKAFAYLEGEFTEEEQDIHPLNRARQVLAVSSGIRKNMVLGRLFKDGTVPDARHKDREPEEIIVPPSKQTIVNEILEDLSMREARNALVLIGKPGWSQRDILPTEGLLEELRKAAPEVAEEFESRLTKGKNKVYPFEGVAKVWPLAKQRLVKDGADADLTDLRIEAANP